MGLKKDILRYMLEGQEDMANAAEAFARGDKTMGIAYTNSAKKSFGVAEALADCRKDKK